MTEPHEPSSAKNPRIIRRAPTAAIPAASGYVRPGGMPTAVRTARGPTGTAAFPEPSATIPIAACAVAILSGWATSVVATDLIAGWWQSDRLFCVAVGFLTLVFAVTTISGVILLLRHRSLGRYLVPIGAVVALLTFGSLFIAGARVPWIVHAIPVLQIASAVLALHPATKRWLLVD